MEVINLASMLVVSSCVESFLRILSHELITKHKETPFSVTYNLFIDNPTTAGLYLFAPVLVFSRMNATLEAAVSVCWSVGPSVRHITFLKYGSNLHFKGTLGYFRVL